jgi:phospholipid/cholesterol/gamma-HCH transport system substrate-binding protein
MLSRTTRIQLIAFVVIAVLGVTYLAIRYVGIGQWLGLSGYTVKADFPQAGGIFSNAEVDYRGAPVGRVGDIRLTATGVQVDLNISSGDSIPKDVTAVVTDRSAIGEQYVNLIPKTRNGPYLRDGSLIRRADTQIPPPVSALLLSTDELAHSVPIGALQTTVSELYDATQGVHAQLAELINSGQAFFSTAQQHLPQTIDLIGSSKTVLETLNQESRTITSYATDLDTIGNQLKRSNGDISKILAAAPAAANTVTGLFNQLGSALRGLLSDLLVTSDVFLANHNGVRQVLVDLPVSITIAGAVTTPQGINVGLVPTFFDPQPCTQGYGATPVRPGLSISGNPALNTSAGCTASLGSGQDVHGSQNAPK